MPTSPRSHQEALELAQAANPNFAALSADQRIAAVKAASESAPLTPAALYRNYAAALIMSEGYSATINRTLFDHGQAIGPAPLAIVFTLRDDPSTYCRRIVPTLAIPAELYVAFTLYDMGLDVEQLDVWTLTEDNIL